MISKLKEDLSRIIQQNYVLSSQYESLDSDDLYTKYKVWFEKINYLLKDWFYLETSTTTWIFWSSRRIC